MQCMCPWLYFCGDCSRSCSYSSGGEDGYVRVHTFDPSYFEFEIES